MWRVFLLGLTFLLPSFATSSPKQAFAVVAGGCFWCMEPPYEKIDGVISVTSGFSGGDKANPSYKEVAGNKTKHVEAVKIVYETAKVTYDQILEIYWKQVDPTDIGGQFVDRGHAYKPVVFYSTDEEKKKAEDSHQDYYKKNPLRYKYYRYNSGRDQYLEKYWGKVEIDY